MVQGKTKGLTNKTSSTRHSAKAAANMKKGKKYIAPKKPILMKQASMQKVGSLDIDHLDLFRSTNIPS